MKTISKILLILQKYTVQYSCSADVYY